MSNDFFDLYRTLRLDIDRRGVAHDPCIRRSPKAPLQNYFFLLGFTEEIENDEICWNAGQKAEDLRERLKESKRLLDGEITDEIRKSYEEFVSSIERDVERGKERFSSPTRIDAHRHELLEVRKETLAKSLRRRSDSLSQEEAIEEAIELGFSNKDAENYICQLEAGDPSVFRRRRPWLRAVLDWFTQFSWLGEWKPSWPIILATIVVLPILVSSLLVPISWTDEAKVSRSAMPSNTMPVYRFAKRPETVKSVEKYPLARRLVKRPAYSDQQLGVLFDGDGSTAWKFVEAGRSRAMEVAFKEEKVVEGIVVLNGTRGVALTRCEHVDLKFDDDSVHRVTLKTHGNWQFGLFDAKYSKSVGISVPISNSGSSHVLALGEMWFLEGLETNGSPEQWARHWRLETDRIELQHRGGAWFAGFYHRSEDKRRVILREWPEDENIILAGSISRGEEFGADIVCESLELRLLEDGSISARIAALNGSREPFLQILK